MVKLLRLPVVLQARGRGRASHYADIGKGLFTRPVNIGPHSVGWPDYEVEELNRARIAGKSDDEIRTIVKQLEAYRLITRDCLILVNAGTSIE